MTTETLNHSKSKNFFFLKRTDRTWILSKRLNWDADFLACVFSVNEKREQKFCYAKDLLFGGYVPRLEFIPPQIRHLIEQEVAADIQLADTAFYKLRSDANWERCSSDDEPRLIVCTEPPRSPAYNKFCGAVDLVSGQDVALHDLPVQVIKDLTLSGVNARRFFNLRADLLRQDFSSQSRGQLS